MDQELKYLMLTEKKVSFIYGLIFGLVIGVIALLILYLTIN